MAGMDRNTGRWLDGWAHVAQSLDDIVGTPLLERVMCRIYGASEDALVDKPLRAKALTAPVMAVAIPINHWEPRVDLKKVTLVEATVSGKAGLLLSSVHMPNALFGDMTPEALMTTGVGA